MLQLQIIILQFYDRNKANTRLMSRKVVVEFLGNVGVLYGLLAIKTSSINLKYNLLN